MLEKKTCAYVRAAIFTETWHVVQNPTRKLHLLQSSGIDLSNAFQSQRLYPSVTSILQSLCKPHTDICLLQQAS